MLIIALTEVAKILKLPILSAIGGQIKIRVINYISDVTQAILIYSWLNNYDTASQRYIH